MNSKDKLEEKFIKACCKKKKQPRQRNEMIYNQKK